MGPRYQRFQRITSLNTPERWKRILSSLSIQHNKTICRILHLQSHHEHMKKLLILETFPTQIQTIKATSKVLTLRLLNSIIKLNIQIKIQIQQVKWTTIQIPKHQHQHHLQEQQQQQQIWILCYHSTILSSLKPQRKLLNFFNDFTRNFPLWMLINGLLLLKMTQTLWNWESIRQCLPFMNWFPLQMKRHFKVHYTK